MISDAFSDEIIAKVYDAFNLWGLSDVHYQRLAHDVSGPVLDIGCGTGMLAVRLAGEGVDMVGIDRSEAMLAVARSREGGDKVAWYQMAARDFALDQRFALIYMTGHVFQFLISDADIAAMLTTARRHLAPNGMLAFETRNPGQEIWTEWAVEEEQEVQLDPYGGVTYSHYDLEIRPISSAAGLIVSFVERYRSTEGDFDRAGEVRLRFTPKPYLDRLLADAGFSNRTYVGDWDGSPVEDTSPEIIAYATV